MVNSQTVCSRVGALYQNLPHLVMRMSPNSAMLGLAIRLFGTQPLVPPPFIPPEQLLAHVSSDAAIADCGLHVDLHALVVANIASQKLLDVDYHNKKVRPMSFFVVD